MKYLVATLFILLAYNLYAIEVPGKIIYDGSKTEDVTLIVPMLSETEPHFFRMQDGIRFINKDGKKRSADPEHAKEFQFTIGDKQYRVISQLYQKGLDYEQAFMPLLIDGPVKLFRYHYLIGDNNAPVDAYVLQRGDDKPKVAKRAAFKKFVMDYFSDCNELVKVIDDTNYDFGESNIIAIVTYYNTKCN